MKSFKSVALVAAFFMLTACTGGAQEYAGINHAVIDFHEDGKPKRIDIIGGKESDSIDALFTKGDMRVEYHVRGQRAVESQYIQAEVRKLLIEEFGDVSDSVLKRLFKLFPVIP